LAIARRWDETSRKEQLPTFFTGTAGQWLAVRRTTTFAENNQELRPTSSIPWATLTWSQVKSEVISHYLPDDYYDHLRSQPEEKQQRGEDIVSFFDKKVYIANKLRRTPGETMKAIKRTLLPEYQKTLGVYETFNLDELLYKLKEAHLIIKRMGKFGRNEQRRRDEPSGRREGQRSDHNRPPARQRTC